MITISVTATVRDGCVSLVQGTPREFYNVELASRGSFRDLASIRVQCSSPMPQLLPDGTLVYIEGVATRSSTEPHHLELATVRFHPLSEKPPLKYEQSGSISITGVVRGGFHGYDSCLTVEIETARGTPWVVGVDLSSYPETIFDLLSVGTKVHVRGAFLKLYSHMTNTVDVFMIFKPFDIKDITPYVVNPAHLSEL